MTEETNITNDSLGLRTKREALGLSLKDVFNSTRISVINLEAIENGNFQELPASIYTRNFIKTYARALGVDGKPILDSYEAYLNSRKAEKTPPEEPEPKKEGNLVKAILNKTYIWKASVIIIIVAIVYFVLQTCQSSPKVTATAPTQATKPLVNQHSPADIQIGPAEAPVPVVIATNKQTPAAVQIPAQIPAQPAAPVIKQPGAQNISGMEKIPAAAPAAIDEESSRLIVSSTEETWLRIKTDQNPSFQVILKAGEKIERRGTSFDLDIGNAGGIKVKFNGKVIENLGRSGQVIHLRLP